MTKKDLFAGPDKQRDENARKLTELIKIKGSCEQVERQLKQTSKIRKSRFKKVMDYFRKLEDRLKLFEIYAEP